MRLAEFPPQCLRQTDTIPEKLLDDPVWITAKRLPGKLDGKARPGEQQDKRETRPKLTADTICFSAALQKQLFIVRGTRSSWEAFSTQAANILQNIIPGFNIKSLVQHGW
jgi:hypothetical protein